MTADFIFPPGLPKYRVIADEIREAIRNNDVGPNNEMVADNHLMKRFGVSRATVRQAMDLLVAEGLIVREVGRGTFIRKPKKRKKQYMIRIMGYDLPSILNNAYLVDLLFGIETEAAKSDVQISIHTRREERLLDDELQSLIQSDKYHLGIVLIWRYPGEQVRELVNMGIPVLAINMDYRRYGGASILTPYHKPGTITDLLKPLKDAGHKRVKIVSLELLSEETRSIHQEGVDKAVKSFGFAKDTSTIDYITEAKEDAVAFVEKLFNTRKPPTALCILNEAVMMNIIGELQKRGIQIPGDVSVIGVATVDFDLFYQGYRINQREEGRIAGNMVVSMLRNPQKKVDPFYMPMTFHKGGSVGKPKK